MILGILWFGAVLFSHPADLDAYLAHANAMSSLEHIPAAGEYRELSGEYARLQPGWFPVGALPLAAWILHWVVMVKTLQVALMFAALGTFALIVRRLWGSNAVALLAVVFVICTWQFRWPHDPLIGTSLVTMWSVVLVLLSYLGWLTYRDSRNAAVLVATCGVLILAALTGPIALGLEFVLALMALRDAQLRAAAATLMGLTLLCAGASLLVAPFEGPWHHGGFYPANALAQLVAGLPASFRAFGFMPVGHVPALYHDGVRYVDDRFINIPEINLWGWLAVLVAAGTGYVCLQQVRTAENAQENAVTQPLKDTLLAGAAFWIVPALMLGPFAWWQHGLPYGQSFDGVCFEYFGVAAIATALTVQFTRRPGTLSLMMPALMALGIFVVCYGNVRANHAALARSARADEAHTLVQQAAAAGFFNALPDGSTIVLGRELSSWRRDDARIADPKYALYDYTKRRFNVGVYPHQGDWLLDAARTAPMPVTLMRVSRIENGKIETDTAYGFTTAAGVQASARQPKRGLQEQAFPLRDGTELAVRRTCGPVAQEDVFDEALPVLEWGEGAYASGPVGYAKAKWRPGTLYPKAFIESRATLLIHRTPCPPTAITLPLQVVSGSRGILKIYSPNHVDKVAISPKLTTFTLRYLNPAKVTKVVFETNAPPADLDPVLFRYERDRPRGIRAVMEPVAVWEDLARPMAAKPKGVPVKARKKT